MGEGGPESLSLAIGLTVFAPDCRLLFTFITHKLQEHLVSWNIYSFLKRLHSCFTSMLRI